MWDLGATNGIVHIIDSILSDPDDETVDIGLTTPTVKSTTAMSTSVSTATVSTVETVRTTVKISGASVPHTNFICLILVLIFFN